MFFKQCKNWLKNAQAGFGLLETIVAIGLFMIVVSAGTGGSAQSYRINRLSDNEVEATRYAQEGVEGIRSIFNQDWANLTVGTHGLDDSGGTWALSGSSNTTGPFTRTVTITTAERDGSGNIVASGGTVDPDTFKVMTEVTWDFSAGRSNSVDFVTYFTNFRKAISVAGNEADDLAVDAIAANVGGGGTRELRDVFLENIGTSNITIDTITVEWVVNTTVDIERIRIDGTNYWVHNGTGTPDGRQASGVELDIDDLVLLPGDNLESRYRFQSNMSSETEFTITYKMLDGSTKVEVVNFGATPTPTPTPLPCGATEADDFALYIGSVGLGGGNRNLTGIDAENIGSDVSCTVTITNIKVDWDNSVQIDSIRYEGSNIWAHNGAGTPNGRQDSGTTLNVTDTLILTTDGVTDFNRFRFRSSMSGATFGITFTFSDASTKVYNGITP